MEFLEGGELHQHQKKMGRFTQPQVKFYVSEVALALEYLHKKSIAYRDLKPENMVIHKDGHVMLTDFGLAKHVEKGQKTYSFCGTPEYICPEIINSDGKLIDESCSRTYIYSLLIFTFFHFNFVCNIVTLFSLPFG